MELKGKTALVFGAGNAGNMGAAIARRFIQAGADVIVSGRSAERTGAVATAIGARSVICDVTSEADVATAASWLKDNAETPDILINTIGVSYHSSLQEAEAEDIERVFRTHVYGPIYLIKHIAPLMQAGGAIIMVSSVVTNNHCNPPGEGIYAASKTALNKIVRTAAVEFGERGLRVNAIAPGLVQTPMGAHASESMGAQMVRRMLNRTPLGRLASAEDIADCALFLASDACFMTGEVLHPNGGFALFDSGVPANDLALA
jgi:NAD(P)-dependent dehydrogenase (short-subunit alcohol dehydrogenase family)